MTMRMHLAEPPSLWKTQSPRIGKSVLLCISIFFPIVQQFSDNKRTWGAGTPFPAVNLNSDYFVVLFRPPQADSRPNPSINPLFNPRDRVRVRALLLEGSRVSGGITNVLCFNNQLSH